MWYANKTLHFLSETVNVCAKVQNDETLGRKCVSQLVWHEQSVLAAQEQKIRLCSSSRSSACVPVYVCVYLCKCGCIVGFVGNACSITKWSKWCQKPISNFLSKQTHEMWMIKTHCLLNLYVGMKMGTVWPGHNDLSRRFGYENSNQVTPIVYINHIKPDSGRQVEELHCKLGLTFLK